VAPFPGTAGAPIATRRWREASVLAAGLGSALALLAAAASLSSEGDAAAEIELARLAGEVADSAAREWERLLRSPEPPAASAGEAFAWDAGARLGPRPSVERLEGGESGSAFDLLLSDARRVELRGAGPAAALRAVLDALERVPDAPRRPEGLLRAIQLAVEVEDVAAARRLFADARRELDGREARAGISYLLLCGLALGPALEPSERAALGRELAELWDGGNLALPEGEDRAQVIDGELRFLASATVDRLRERLALLGPAEADATWLARDLERRRALALGRAVGELPAPARERWETWALGERVLLARRSEGRVHARAADPRELGAALASRLALPADFALDFGGAGAPPGEPVRARQALAGGVLAFEVRHRAPERFFSARRQRLVALRGALVLLGLFCAFAGALTSRALVRGRRLGELKSAFIAGVSHDLRTPLSSILLMAENLAEGRVGEERAGRYYASIRREADRLRRLVDDVLDFSRLERGEGAPLSREETDVARFFDELAAELAAHAERAGARLEARAEGLPASGSLDRDALRRAVWNLVDNALKHGGGGEIGLAARFEAPSTLVLEVADRGPGIPAREREAVFAPFARAGRGANGAAPGTGLGLAIVRQIATAHGGSVQVLAGEDGVGARLSMRLDLS